MAELPCCSQVQWGQRRRQGHWPSASVERIVPLQKWPFRLEALIVNDANGGRPDSAAGLQRKRMLADPPGEYEILSDGPNGVPIKYGKIGETVYHKWSCVSELTDVYCMRVHSCTVYDGQGGPPVTVLDVNGCSVDGVILQNLDYTSDLTAGKAAQVFKFADKTGLYFNCQIQLTIKDKQYGCTTAACSLFVACFAFPS
ncbi:hypothetical protein ANCCEY_04232 [Ancylostoma ceylanicum]|uniref:ZP domain-containing protein n=1 Tax=Ancylostoma ceylanicum TaxID=53326 RepID=A0A0D6LX73_9BILA|nr:hypothetical protein ANCCEY_04232 [Ancylostoma ceylanicum]